jgi:hypothetical protein
MGEEPAVPTVTPTDLRDRLRDVPERWRDTLAPLAQISAEIDDAHRRVQHLQAALAEAKTAREVLIGRRGQLVRDLHAEGVPLKAMEGPTGLGPARINQLKRGVRA